MITEGPFAKQITKSTSSEQYPSPTNAESPAVIDNLSGNILDVTTFKRCGATRSGLS
jgi:hypothetical protein